jgi:hypothetical protein
MSAADPPNTEPANRVLVVRARHEPFNEYPFVVHLLAEEWRRRGISVDVTDSLAEPTGPDVLVFPHIDLTTTPPRLAEKLGRCARVINRKVIDISKRVISRQLVASPGEYDGPVIVKTNLNFGGKPEYRVLAAVGGEPLHKLNAMMKIPWPVSAMLQPEKYPIYDNPGLVPPQVWGNQQLVVEKFLPEREGDLYCLRQYVFLGSAEFNTRAVSPDPRVKSGEVVRREVLDATPPAVRAFREELGFDYGKFDYVMHEGKAIVFDVNRTFSYNPDSRAGSAHSLLMSLADGIEPLLGRR